MIKIEFLEESGKQPVEIDAETLREALEIAAERKIDLSYAVLEAANLFGASISRINLHGANLRGADLRGANLRGANLSKTVLVCATCVRTWLVGADLSESNLCDADLSYAYLNKACLTKADLNAADLSMADFRDTDLTGANLDYSGLPLWCGSLNIKIDKRIFCQLLYHVMSAGQSVDDEEVRKLFTIPEVVNLANQFHHVNTCGELMLFAKKGAQNPVQSEETKR